MNEVIWFPDSNETHYSPLFFRDPYFFAFGVSFEITSAHFFAIKPIKFLASGFQINELKLRCVPGLHFSNQQTSFLGHNTCHLEVQSLLLTHRNCGLA